jgi:hypothetical protein
MANDTIIILHQSPTSSLGKQKFTYEVAQVTGRLDPKIGDTLTESQAQAYIDKPRTKVVIKPHPKRR